MHTLKAMAMAMAMAMAIAIAIATAVVEPNSHFGNPTSTRVRNYTPTCFKQPHYFLIMIKLD